MDQNEFGKIAHEEWSRTTIIRPYVVLDEFSVMPNHIHGIIHLTDRRGTACRAPDSPTKSDIDLGTACRAAAKTGEKFGKPTVGTIPTIVRAFKSAISKRIYKINPEFKWQRNYWEHIIRDGKSLYFIRKYIRENPLNWEADHEKHIDREIAEFEMEEMEID